MQRKNPYANVKCLYYHKKTPTLKDLINSIVDFNPIIHLWGANKNSYFPKRLTHIF